MLRRTALLALLLLPVIAVPGGGQDVLPVPVFVTARTFPLPPVLTAEQHGYAIKAAENDMFALAAQMRKEHGDKMESWPPAAIQAVDDKEDAWNRAKVRGYYETRDTQLGLDDSVQDFVRGAAKSKALTVATTADAAAFVVIITNRRYTSTDDITGNRYFIRFRLRPGGQMTGERFLALTAGYRWNQIWAQVLTRPHDASGFVELDAGSMASYKNCAASVRAVVEHLIWDRLGPPKTRKK
jgi:hypothetical protein